MRNPGAKWHRSESARYHSLEDIFKKKRDLREYYATLADHEIYDAVISDEKGTPNPKKRHGHSSAYTRFVEKNLPVYVREGMHPTDAMKEVARDWQGYSGAVVEHRVDRNPTSSGLSKFILPVAVVALVWWLVKKK